MSEQDCLSLVSDMHLDEGHYAIFGSGPLLVRGIIDASGDLDIVCRGPVWERVKRQGELRYLERYDVTIASFYDGRVSFGTRWGIGDFDIDSLIDTAEMIDDLPFVRLEHVIEYKKIANRPKDVLHLDAIRQFLNSR